MVGFATFSQGGGFELSGRLLKRVNIVGLSVRLLRGVLHGICLHNMSINIPMDICMHISMDISMDILMESSMDVSMDIPCMSFLLALVHRLQAAITHRVCVCVYVRECRRRYLCDCVVFKCVRARVRARS